MAQVIIRGSWGDLNVDRATGTILTYDDGSKQDWDADDVGYHDILYILPETLAPGAEQLPRQVRRDRHPVRRVR